MSESVSKYAPIPGKSPGTAVNLGGREFVLAPLNLFQIEALEATIAQLGNNSGLKESLELSIPLVLASMQRNYPDVTADDVRGLLDLGNFMAVTKSIITSSGYAPAEGESLPASQ